MTGHRLRAWLGLILFFLIAAFFLEHSYIGP